MPIILTPDQVTALNNLPGFPNAQGLLFGDYIQNLILGYAAQTIVWRPGEPNPRANVFSSWTDALAAAQQTNGLVNILLDDSLSALTIPAGTYDFQNRIGLVAANSGSSMVVTLSDGVVFQNPGEWRSPFRLVELRSQSVAPVMTSIAGTTLRLVLEYFRCVSAAGAAPFFSVPTGTTAYAILRNGADLNGASGVPVVNTEGTFVAIMLAGTSLTGTYATGAGVFSAVIHASSADAPAPGGAFAGTFNLVLDTDAADFVGYTPGNGADWVDPDPNTVGNAIDRIAAAVVGLLAGPIP